MQSQNASRPRRVPSSLPRRLFALATESRLARGYLAAFAASVLVMFLFPDSGFAVSSMVLTAPLSFLGVVLPFGPGTEGGGAAEVSAVVLWAVWLGLCALVNAAVLGALAGGSTTAASPRTPTPARSPRTGRQRTRELLTPAVDNWLSRGYLAVVAAALGFFLVAVYALPDPGFAGIWPLMSTAPFSFLTFLVEVPADDSALAWLNPLTFSAGVALSGLFNAVLLGHLARRLRVREARPAA
ncbi:SCO4225 family membrane protein [Streptomyces sp. NPDC001858]